VGVFAVAVQLGGLVRAGADPGVEHGLVSYPAEGSAGCWGFVPGGGRDAVLGPGAVRQLGQGLQEGDEFVPAHRLLG